MKRYKPKQDDVLKLKAYIEKKTISDQETEKPKLKDGKAND
jgi:acyl-CoA-binding protein